MHHRVLCGYFLSQMSWNEINSCVCAGLSKHLRNQQDMPNRLKRCFRPCIMGTKERNAISNSSSSPCSLWTGRNGYDTMVRSQIPLTEKVLTVPATLIYLKEGWGLLLAHMLLTLEQPSSSVQGNRTRCSSIAWLCTIQRVTPCSTTKSKSDGSLHL